MRNLLILAVAALALSGCAARQQTITNLPVGVTQTQVQAWDTAVSKLHTVATVSSTLRQTVITLHNTIGPNGQALIPSGNAYVMILDSIGKIDQAENAASVFLQTVPNNWPASTKAQIAGYMSAISSALTTLTQEGTLGIPAANQANVTGLITSIGSAVTAILAL